MMLWLEKPFISNKFSDELEDDNNKIITKVVYDKLGRGVKTYYKNTDNDYDGNMVFQLLSEIEYLDAENTVNFKIIHW